MNEEKQFHINLRNDFNARYAIICGAPERVPLIAKYLVDSKFITRNREYTTYCGYLSGEKVLVTSVGIGGPSASIGIEELHHIGVDTIIRVGTCGGIDINTTESVLVIPSAAIRMDGTTKEYAPIEFPAVADFEITSALVNACKDNNAKYKIGVVQSKDSFYGQHFPQSTAVFSELSDKWDAWKKCGALASEMECSTLFVVSALRKIRSGAVLQVIWNRERANSGYEKEEAIDNEQAISIAVKAMEIIINADMQA